MGKSSLSSIFYIPEHKWLFYQIWILKVIKAFDNRPLHSVGLLVSDGNDKARKLYTNIGFVPIAKKVLLGKNLEHLQYNGPAINDY